MRFQRMNWINFMQVSYSFTDNRNVFFRVYGIFTIVKYHKSCSKKVVSEEKEQQKGEKSAS